MASRPADTRKLIANLVAMRSLQHIPARQASNLWLLYNPTILCDFIYASRLEKPISIFPSAKLPKVDIPQSYFDDLRVSCHHKDKSMTRVIPIVTAGRTIRVQGKFARDRKS